MMTPEQVVESKLYKHTVKYVKSIPPNEYLFNLTIALNSQGQGDKHMELRLMHESISSAFAFAITPQGSDYWWEIHREINRNFLEDDDDA